MSQDDDDDDETKVFGYLQVLPKPVPADGPEFMVREMLWKAWEAGYYIDEIEKSNVGSEDWLGDNFVTIKMKAVAKKRKSEWKKETSPTK